MRAAIYARVSTRDQHTLEMQLGAARDFAARRGWQVTLEVPEIGSGAKNDRKARAKVLEAARRRTIDAVIVWRLDRWGRSVPDLSATMHELSELGVAFVSVTEALDLSTSAGKAMAGMLAVFAAFERDILRERVRAGVADARAKGIRLGRPPRARNQEAEIKRLAAEGIPNAQIARRLGIGRPSVIRILNSAANRNGAVIPSSESQE